VSRYLLVTVGVFLVGAVVAWGVSWPGGRTHTPRPLSDHDLLLELCESARVQVELCQDKFDAAFDTDVQTAVRAASGRDAIRNPDFVVYPARTRQQIRDDYRSQLFRVNGMLNGIRVSMPPEGVPIKTSLAARVARWARYFERPGGVVTTMVHQGEVVGTGPVRLTIVGADWDALRAEEVKLRHDLLLIRAKVEEIVASSSSGAGSRAR
jgi:hypothetical protein